MTEKRVRQIEAEMGDYITTYVTRLIEEKKRLKQHPMIEGEFNGVIFHVTNDTTEEELLVFFDTERDRLRAEYQASEAYKAHQKEEQSVLQMLNQEASALVEQLRTLDLTDYKEALKWVKTYQPYSDRSGVHVPKEEILELFTENGYEINANTYEQFQINDSENHARWIIGQALDGIEKLGAMHPMVVTFTERWEEKFLVSQ